VIDGQKNGSVRRVSDLRALPFVVLLGEPGKSTVLEDAAAHEGLRVIKVRELMTGPPVGQGGTLFLDALDEYRTDGGPADKVHTLAHVMTAAKPARWRLTCRSEDWRKHSDKGTRFVLDLPILPEALEDLQRPLPTERCREKSARRDHSDVAAKLTLWVNSIFRDKQV
jgi:hypothetical protein